MPKAARLGLARSLTLARGARLDGLDVGFVEKARHLLCARQLLWGLGGAWRGEAGTLG